MDLGFLWPQSTNMNGSVWVDAIDYSWSSGYFANRSYYYNGSRIHAYNGTWTSNIVDLNGTIPYFENLTLWCEIEATITEVNISYRISNSSSAITNATWSAWSDANTIFNDYKQRYVQIRIKLTTNDRAHSPSVTLIKFHYIY